MKKEQVRQLNPSLNSVLPHGAHKRIAKDLGLFVLTVSNAIKGKNNNERVIARALEVVREERDRMNDFLKQAEKLEKEG